MLKLLITFGGNVTDYSRYTDWQSIDVKEAQTVPSTMTFSIVPIDSTFAIPPVMAYVQLWSTAKKKSVFSGFVSSHPVRQYLAKHGLAVVDPTYLGDQPSVRIGQLLKYDITCTSDEFLLNSKAIPFIPAFSNRSQGDILTTLADNLCPGFYDYSYVASGDLVPYLTYDPKVSWCELAKKMGDGARYRYKARDKKLWYQPYGDQALGIVYDERQRDSGFSPRDLVTSVLTIPLVNDVTVIGDSEAGNNHVDYFLGDGFTGNFPLLHKVFRGASNTLAQESWTGGELNTQQWYLQDPGDNFDFSAGSLNVVNTQAAGLPLGSSFLQFQNGMELAGGLQLQAGEVIFEDYCDGFINTLYKDDTFALDSVIAGFYTLAQGGFGAHSLTASGAVGIGMSAWFDGQAIAPFLISQANHSYVLSMTITAPKYTRYDQTYRTVDGEEFGGGFTQILGSITFTIQDYDIGAATGLFYQPAVATNTVNDVALPAFALYALANQRRLNVSVTNTTLANTPLGGLYAFEGPNGWQRPTIGTFAGTVTIAGTTVTRVTGPKFDSTWVGQTLSVGGVGGVPFNVASVVNSNTLTLSQAPGDHGSPVAYLVTLTIGLLLPLVPPSSGGFALPYHSPGFLGAVAAWSDPPSPNIFPDPGLIHQNSIMLAMGSGFSLQAAQITAGQNADTLAFYAQSLPAAGVPVAIQSFESQAAVSRLQVSGSIVQQKFVVGDDGIRSAIVTDLNPLPRTSEDCDSAAQAFLADRTEIQYNGSYKCTTQFFHGSDSDEQYWPTVGRFLNVHSPARGINNRKMLVTALGVRVLDAVTELMEFAITFGADLHLEKVLKNFVDLQPLGVLAPLDRAVPPNPRFTVQLDNSFLPDLSNVGIDVFRILDNTVTVNVSDPWTGYIEVRNLDTNWGSSLGRAVTQAQLVAQAVAAGYPAPQSFTGWQWNFFWEQLSGTSAPDPVILFPSDPLGTQYLVATYLAALLAAGFNTGIITDRTLVALVKGPSFTLLRQQYDQRWYLRPVSLPDGGGDAVTSRRSMVLRLKWPLPPSPPLFVSDNALVVQFNFNGDQRNIYGFELRWRTASGPVVLVQKPVASYADLLIDLEQTALSVVPGSTFTSWNLEAYFFNAAWAYSQALKLTEFTPEVKDAGTLINPGYFTIIPVAGVATIDLALGTGPTFNFRVVLTAGIPLTFAPPVYTGKALKLGMSISVYLDQDVHGGADDVTFSNAAGGFAQNTRDQITIVTTALTRTSLTFTYHGIWSLDNPPNTGAHTQ